jgi:hypothetical protein
VRCSLLRPDPAQRAPGWKRSATTSKRASRGQTRRRLGEVERLQVSHSGVDDKRAQLDHSGLRRASRVGRGGSTDLVSSYCPCRQRVRSGFAECRMRSLISSTCSTPTASGIAATGRTFDLPSTWPAAETLRLHPRDRGWRVSRYHNSTRHWRAAWHGILDSRSLKGLYGPGARRLVTRGPPDDPVPAHRRA